MYNCLHDPVILLGLHIYKAQINCQEDELLKQTRFPQTVKKIIKKMRNVMIHRGGVFFSCAKPLSILPSLLTPPHLRLCYSSSAAAAAASSPNRAIHCMANDSPLSQPLTGGDGSVSVPPTPSASSAIDFLSLCSRLKVMQPNDPPIVVVH